MTRIAIESPAQPEIASLLAMLDVYLGALYPPECNYILDIDALCQPDIVFAVARDANGIAIGCAAIRLDDGFAELKRMFMHPASRGGGVAKRLIGFLETQAMARGFSLLLLETGIYQPEAIGLYEGIGFIRRGSFGNYPDDPRSLFMGKTLAQ